MVRQGIICNAVVMLALLAGCNHVKDRLSAVEPYLPGDASVAFELEARPTQNGSHLWVARYNSRGKVAKFRIELDLSQSIAGKTARNFGITSGEGRLIPEETSDSSIILVDLQKALQAKIATQPPLKKTTVTFTYADIGDDLSQANGGGFNANPRGNWTGLKLFFGEGDQESEVFLNVNTSMRKGQFSMKDPDYGDLVLAELAKTL
jgi:hypothetical protein